MSALTAVAPAVIAALAAFAVGIMATFAPCALTSNLAAVAFVTAGLSDPRRTALAGLAYAAGRAVTYSLAGLIIFWLGTEIIESTEALRSVASLLFGLAFMVAGAVILEKLRLNVAFGDGLRRKLQAAMAGKPYGSGVPGAFGLGAVFALAFCPYMAALFFGVLVPLALATPMIGAALPAAFGVGSALPVLAFALLAAGGVTTVKGYTEQLRLIEPLIRRLFGAGMIVFGAYLVLTIVM